MTAAAAARQPAGIPAGGQFTAQDRAEDRLQLIEQFGPATADAMDLANKATAMLRELHPDLTPEQGKAYAEALMGALIAGIRPEELFRSQGIDIPDSADINDADYQALASKVQAEFMANLNADRAAEGERS